MVDSHPRQTLPRSVRVRSRLVFTKIFERKLSVSDRRLIVYGGRNQENITRLGISIGRRFGNAVRRNRCKRLIREAFRRIRHELPPGLDCIVIPKPGPEPTLAELQDSLRTLAGKLAGHPRL